MAAQTTDDRWFWEDYEVGWSDVTQGRTVAEADIVGFAGLSGDFHPAHVDREYAIAAGYYPDRIAHGLLGLAFVTGLLSRDAPRVLGTQFAGVAFLGLTWRFAGALFAGDTIRVRYTIASKRLTSSPERGIVEHGIEVVTQNDEVVQSGTLTMMIAVREPGAVRAG